METIRELAKFNHIKYYDDPHLYYIDGAGNLCEAVMARGGRKKKKKKKK